MPTAVENPVSQNYAQTYQMLKSILHTSIDGALPAGVLSHQIVPGTSNISWLVGHLAFATDEPDEKKAFRDFDQLRESPDAKSRVVRPLASMICMHQAS